MKELGIEILKTFLTVAICLFIAWLFFGRGAMQNEHNTSKTSRETLWVGIRDIIHELKTEHHAPVENHFHTEVFNQGPIDTGAIVRDYFTQRTYQDTARNDSVEIYLKADVYKNFLLNPLLSYKLKLKERIIKETTTNTIHKNDFYIGTSVTILPKSYPLFSIDALAELPNWAIGGGYDFINRSPKVSVYRKINFKRKPKK